MKRSRSTAAETLVTDTPTAAGQKMLVELRADETLLIERVTFSGDDGARLRSIFIGRKSYLNSSNGMKLSEFKATNMQNLNIVGAKVPQGTHVKFEIEASSALQAVDVNIFGKWISAERC